MQSNNGLYKVNIFDPDTETWARRAEPCTRANWTRDPFGLQLFAGNPNAPFYEGCDPRDQQSTQPSDPSDQKYARWYPSAIPLPDDTVLVVGGFDQDNTVPPDPDRVAKGRQNRSQSDTAFTATRVNQVVTEVYDPKTDRNIALENARMAFPLYPQLEVVQTGPEKDDWKVCTFNGEIDYGHEPVPGGARFGVGGGTPRLHQGHDLVPGRGRGAEGPEARRAGEEPLDAARHGAGSAAVLLPDREPHRDRRRRPHRLAQVVHDFGTERDGEQTGTVEVMDFTDAKPRWRKVGDILQPLSTTKAVLLPDGKVLIGQGVNRSGNCNVDGRPCTFEEREGHHFQMFDPASGSITRLAKTTVSRGLHGTATLLPGRHRVLRGRKPRSAGAPRRSVVSADELVCRPAAARRPGPGRSGRSGLLRRLTCSSGAPATRPVIAKAPEKISVSAATSTSRSPAMRATIASVVLLRSDHNTHSLTAGDRYVKLAFREKERRRAARQGAEAARAGGAWHLHAVRRGQERRAEPRPPRRSQAGNPGS